MAEVAPPGEMKRTLSLTGVTVNAMALIAPGAFLWTTFQLQAAQTAGKSSTAPDMWTGLAFALILALLTAYSYAELARVYHDAGTGSSYYFAEAALLEKERPQHRKWARTALAHSGASGSRVADGYAQVAGPLASATGSIRNQNEDP